MKDGQQRAAGASTARRTSLRGLVRRAHVTLAVAAVLGVGLAIAVPAVVTLHLYARHDLQLVARAIGHTVEAAVVFGDVESAQETLESMVAAEDLAKATVLSRDGKVLAHWRLNAAGWNARAGAAVTRLLHEAPAMVPVLHDGALVGQVVVTSGGRTLVQALGLGMLGILLCQALIGGAALFLSGRTVRRIVGPLQALAALTGTVQRERAFGQRVPRAEIKEVNDLGNAFNGLLAELDAWQTLMEGENQRLLHQAQHDGLTGLANRAFFEGRLSRALLEAAQQGSAVGVLLIDCDKFKEVNDGFGHAAGDAVLVGVASRLQGQCREGDIVARLGGDEFAILVARLNDAGRLNRMLDEIQAAMQLPITVQDDLSITVSLSVGAAEYPADGADPAALLQRADQRMYGSKRNRHGPVAEPRPMRQR